MLQRRDGAILNLASTAAFQPGPYLAVYAATKAFVLSFSEALWAEYRKRGVHVVALCPGAVDTPFFDVLGDPAARQTVAMSHPLSADFVATAAIQALLGSHPSRIVGARNWLLAQSVRLAPREFVARTAASVLRAPRSYTAV
jgi:short-subunit dehydrogenase